MAKRLHQTMADYVVIAISPALIMTLVGSLVFFLVQVFYQGEWVARLNWVLACFVFAAVLIGRISIEEGFERAAPFGIALATVVGLAVARFVEVKGPWMSTFGTFINWGLIGLIWWCTHRLTWDCTLVDDSQDSSGEGLLQTSGLERSDELEKTEASLASANVSFERAIEGTTSRGNVPVGWWDRYVERQRRPHAPGVWVVYFSLAALPIFGIGQWFIPAADLGARRLAFWLLCVYVASGFGLLLTTSFLALRRYLRQRRIEMPTSMANLWIGIGAVTIVALLMFSAMLPRPSAEYAISELPFTVGSPEQRSSRFAPVPKEGTQDDRAGSAPDQKPGETATDDRSHSRPSDEAGKATAEPTGKQSSSGQSDSKGDSAKDNSGRSQQSGDFGQKGGASAKGSKSSNDKGSSQRDSKSQSRDNQSRGSQPAGETSDKSKPSAPPDQQPEHAKSAEQSEEQGKGGESNANPPAAMQLLTEVKAAAGGIANLLKWAFYALVILSAIYLMWRFREAVWASIRELLAGLRDFWSNLWGLKRPKHLAASAEHPPEFPPAPFSSFADPFATSVASRYSMTELVRYSFEAFEAWAREHGCPRAPEQTPHELVRDVARLNAPIAADARNLAELYARAAYAQGSLPDSAADQLERLWRQMRATSALSR